MKTYSQETIDSLKATPNQAVSREAVELMGVMKLRERKTGKPVKQPGEIFACLMAMGYRREGETMQVQQRAVQFVETVRERLVQTKRRNPSYNELLQVMTQLGYQRAAAPIEAQSLQGARAEHQWNEASN